MQVKVPKAAPPPAATKPSQAEPAPEPVEIEALGVQLEEPAELVDEQQLGATETGRAANAALRSLSRAARAFTLYDAGNESIHRFLEDYRDRMNQALASGGALAFEVRPFELALGEEVVYRESDRERSLAFRLFRDGVRGLTIEPTVKWEELLRLLEVLSVRFVGVRQQEDDLVTLLDKAGFQAVHYVAVEGFVAGDDEEEEGGSGSIGGSVAVSAKLRPVEVPPDFDLPAPAAGGLKPFASRPVAAPYLQPLQAEEGPATVPSSALRLVRGLLAAASAPGAHGGFEDAARVAGEVRDFLVADRRLEALLQLVELARGLSGPAAAALHPVVDELGSAASLERMIEGLDPELEAPPAALGTLLGLVPGDHVAHLAALFDKSADQAARRRLIKSLISRYAAQKPEALLAAVAHRAGEDAVELFSLVREALPGHAVAAAVSLSAHSDPAMQCAALDALADPAASSEEAARAVTLQLEASEPSVRIAACRAAAARRDLRGYDVISKELQRRSAGLSVEEAAAMGEAMARILPEDARTLMTGWLTAKVGLLKRMAESPSSRMLKFAAVAGLACLPGAEVEKLIREVAAQASSDEELKQHCVATMVRRRKAGGPSHG